MNETQNKWIDHSVNNCDVLRVLIHVLEDKIDFLFRSKICSWPRFSTPDRRFAALSYRRPDYNQLDTSHSCLLKLTHFRPQGRGSYLRANHLSQTFCPSMDNKINPWSLLWKPRRLIYQKRNAVVTFCLLKLQKRNAV